MTLNDTYASIDYFTQLNELFPNQRKEQGQIRTSCKLGCFNHAVGRAHSACVQIKALSLLLDAIILGNRHLKHADESGILLLY